MKYFGIIDKNDRLFCCCSEKALGDYETQPSEEIIEISEEIVDEWAYADYVCPICSSPRIASLRGEIIMKVCRECRFES